MSDCIGTHYFSHRGGAYTVYVHASMSLTEGEYRDACVCSATKDDPGGVIRLLGQNGATFFLVAGGDATVAGRVVEQAVREGVVTPEPLG